MSGPNFKRFYEYLGTLHDERFSWGVHDCLTFTNTAFKILHGRGWADDIAGQYMAEGRAMTRKELQARFGHVSFEDFMANRLRRKSSVPDRGDLVASARPEKWCAGIALGISLGTSAVYLGRVGLQHQPIEYCKAAWMP
ncbi:MAG: hypothetical protein AAF801_09885 [Pseudomonadota bacterium]